MFRRSPRLAARSRLAQPAQMARPPLRYIRAGQGERTHHLDVAEVLFFQSDDKYTVVTGARGEYLIRTTIAELLAQLDPAQFWQVHRSTIVNAHAIKSVGRSLSGKLSITLKNRPETLEVSPSYAHRFKQL